MKIHESEGIRTFRRDVRSFQLAEAIKSVLGGRPEAWLSEVAAAIDASSRGYQAVSRAMPFETSPPDAVPGVGGLVYRVTSDGPARAYHKSKKVVVEPGKIEDFAPARQRSTTIERRVKEEVAKLEGWANVFAMREEARRYMDARLGALEARITALEAKLSTKAIDNLVESD